MAFYENYVKLCAETNKTPSGVAVELGIPKSLVSRWKNGGGVSDVTAQKIATYFNVTLSELLGEKPQKIALFEDVGGFASLDTKKDPAQSAEPKTNEFINLYASLNPEQQAKVEAFAKFLQMEAKE